MTRDDIRRMAREAGFSEWAVQTPQDLERFAALVAQAERKPLTDEEISSLISTSPPSFAVEIVRIIERAHGIGSEK